MGSSSQGVSIPVSLELQNLTDIASQLKKFAGTNILGDSLNGKKIDAELSRVLKTLAQIEARAKNAFKVDSDFTGLEKDINKVELGLDKVHSTIQGLSFSDLKVPEEAQAQFDALNKQISELQEGFNRVKEAQRDSLAGNDQFMVQLERAFGAGGPKMIDKSYDDMRAAIQKGMTDVNTELERQTRIYQQKQKELQDNVAGQKANAAQGVLGFLEKGFQNLPKDSKNFSAQQELLAKYMKIDEKTGQFGNFKSGASYNQFFNELSKMYSLTPEQLAEIKGRITATIQETGQTAGQIMRNMATNQTTGANIMTGQSSSMMADLAAQYQAQQKDTAGSGANVDKLTDKAAAASQAWETFNTTSKAVADAQAQLEAAMGGPISQIQNLEQALLRAATSTPELTQKQIEAAAAIDRLRAAAASGQERLKQMDDTVGKFNGVANFINRYVGLYAIVRKVTTAIKNAFNNIKELDKTITSIAVVTNMSQQDLWGKIGEYTSLAQQYGVATKEVYTVSQIFYQQGLQTAQVMSLTTETLKMAKIAGIDYSTAANAMTVAIRAFKIEMSQAQQVTDTYSALAAKFAVSSSEIASAMEKTASSAANVGMSLQSTSAFISVMEQTTRESAQNIGSALKSIISRYGEMKASPDKLVDSEGQAVAFNKVDTALASIGISIKDASGQFRDFDDVIMELASKWDSLDNNTQRYIATIMAGNRQQSRFIALVSNYGELSRAIETANNAENASIVQVAKTMDSLESKAAQVSNAFSQLYLSLHMEDALKGTYDMITRILKTIGKLGTLKGVLPTLMNVVGFGTGAKSLINYGKESYLKYKDNVQKKVNLQTEEAEAKAKALQESLTQTAIKKVMLQVETTDLENKLNAVQTQVNTTVSNIGTSVMQANPALAAQGITTDQIMQQARQLQANGQLATAEDRAQFMKGYGIDPNSGAGQNINGLLENFQTLSAQAQQLSSSLDTLKTSADQAATSEDRETQANEQGAAAEDRKTTTTDQAANSEQTKVNSAEAAARADLDKAVQAREAARADMEEAQKSAVAAQAEADRANNSSLVSAAEKERLSDAAINRQIDANAAQEAFKKAQADAAAARAALSRAQADNDSEQSKRRETVASDEAATADQREAAASDGVTGAKGGAGSITPRTYNANLMKGIGIASGLARMAGTAITAMGAAHQDRSTDKQEMSKIWTGVGNGLSMAGTGASMGMAFGPWGAAIGAIGGFLLGGLGAIIDGAKMTLAEQIALQEEEVKAAQDESLKKQAKVTDLSSSIDNIRQLKDAMYDSEESMKAYKDAMSTLADQYPELISSYDEQGQAIVDLQSAEEMLAQTRLEAATAARDAAIANAKLMSSKSVALTGATEDLKDYKQLSKATQYESSFTYRLAEDSDEVFENPVIYHGRTVKDSQGNEHVITHSISNYAVQDEYGNYIGTDNQHYSFETLDYDQAMEWAWQEMIRDNEANNHNVRSDRDVTFRDLTLEELQEIALYGANKQNNARDQGQIAPYANINLGEYAASLGGEGLDYGYDVSFFEDILEEYKGTDIFDHKTDVESVFGWKNNPTEAQIQEAIRLLESKLGSTNKAVKNLRAQADAAMAQTSLFTKATLSTELSTDDVSEIQTNSIYTKLFTKALTGKMKGETQYASLMDWEEQDEEGYLQATSEASQEFIEWYMTGLTATQRELLENLKFTQYKSAADIMSDLGLTTDDPYYEEIMAQFIESNEANRNRLLKTIYKVNNGTFSDNTDLQGLMSLGLYEDWYDTGEVEAYYDQGGLRSRAVKKSSLDLLTDRFRAAEDGSSEIVSDYADFFTSELVAINKLAQKGQTTVANTRFNVINSLSDFLAGQDAGVQLDLFKFITGVDFDDYDTLIQAQEDIRAYGEQKGVNVEGIVTLLGDAALKLQFNVVTLAAGLTEEISSASQTVEKTIKTNKSGMALSDAIIALGELQTVLGEAFNFEDIFVWDANLKAYRYTQKGLKASVQKSNAQLEKKSGQIEKQLGVLNSAKSKVAPQQSAYQQYQEEQTAVVLQAEMKELGYTTEEQQRKYLTDVATSNRSSTEVAAAARLRQATLDTAEEFKGEMAVLYGTGYTEETQAAVETLVDAFFSKEGINYTWEEWINFINEQAEAGQKAAKLAQQELKENKLQTRRQLADNIDWASLALGTDYTGINADYRQMLIDSINEDIADVDEQLNSDSTWEQIIDKMLDQEYGGTDEELAATGKTEVLAAKKRRKKAISNAIDESETTQYTTAISELLGGPGAILSETTQALVSKSADMGEMELYADDVITQADNCITAAIKLLKNSGNAFSTVAERNEQIGKILTAKYQVGSSQESLLSAGRTMSIDTLQSDLGKIGIELKDYITDEGTITGDLANAINIDEFGHVIITSWDEFFRIVNKDGTLDENSDIVKKWKRAYTDSVISAADELDPDKITASQITALGNAKIGDRINVSEIKGIVESAGLTLIGDYVQITSEQDAIAIMEVLEAQLRNADWVNDKANAQAVAAARTTVASLKTKFNQNDAWKGVIAEKVSYSAAQTLADALGVQGDITTFMQNLGFTWDNYTKQFIAGADTAEKIRAEIKKIPAIDPNTGVDNREAINSLSALVDNLEDLKAYGPRKAVSDVLTNYTNITNEQIAAFNSAYEGIDLRHFITTDALGRKKLNVAMFRQVMQDSGLEDINSIFAEEIASIFDTNLQDITTAVNLVTTGTTNQSEVQKFLKDYKDLVGSDAGPGAFKFDAILNAWTLDPQVLYNYIVAQGQELVDLGLLKKSELEAYVDKNMRQALAGNINISDFLSAEDKQKGSLAYNTLKTSLVNYFNSSNELANRLIEQYVDNIASKAPESIRDEMKRSIPTDTIADYYIEQIKQGGAQAVEIMRAVAEAQGVELSASDIESAYRAEVSELENALEQITYGPGSIVSGKAVEILEKLQAEGKASIVKIGDGSSAVITSITDTTAAYLAYYNALKETGEATLSAINEAYAKVLETKNGRYQEQLMIDAVGDASGMTYTTFAAMFTSMGIELTDELMAQFENDNIIEHMGGNKMRIKDFARFAEAMGWASDSEQYLSAFSTYNDGLISLNNKVEKDITKEIKNLETAKPGDWLNFTYFANAYEKALTKTLVNFIPQIDQYNPDLSRDQVIEAASERANAYNEHIMANLNMSLQQYGAYIENGILKLTDNANLLGVAQTIQQAAIDAKLNLQDGFDEIADAINNIFKAYSDAISKGIKGGLTNVEKSDLISKAKDLGVGDLSFTQTAEGLKLSEQSAIALYVALKKVDGLQASLVFDDLKTSLEQSNEAFKSSTALVGYLVNTRQKILSADDTVSDARLQQYEAELQVAQEILAVRSTSEDNSFNFMSNKIPAAQNNPLNYAKNWTSALQKIRDAFKVKKGRQKGFMDYTDFYNIVTEMNNIAALGGEIKFGAFKLDGSLESAANAIEAGCKALTTVDSGDLMVNIGSLGMNLKAGTEKMNQGVTDGIHAIADSQIKMIDALIQMLELIVAMEQLGDITGEDNSIDLGDIFSVEGEGTAEENIDKINGFTDAFEKSRKRLIDYLNKAGNEDIKKVFQHSKFGFNGIQRSMYDMLNLDFKTLFPDFENLSPEQKRAVTSSYQGLLNSFYQAAISGDYDLDNIAASVQTIAEQSGIDLKDFVFEFTDDEGKVTRVLTFVGETLVDIDFSDEDTRKAFDQYFGTTYARDQEGYTAYIQGLIERYQNRETTPIPINELVNIRTELGVASNEFSLQYNKERELYSGFYGGEKFQGKDQKEVLKLMAQAALFKDQGFEFEINKDADGNAIEVKGTTTIGKTKIKVELGDNGEPEYSYNGHTSKDKREIMGYMAADGKLEGVDVGTYTIDKNGKKTTVEVREVIGLNFKYSVQYDENGNATEFNFRGQKFNDYASMYNYMTLMNKYDPTEANSHVSQPDRNGKKKNEIVINENAGIKVVVNFDENGIIGEPEYQIGGEVIKGANKQKAFDIIRAAYEKNGENFKVVLDGKEQKLSATYYHLNQQIQVQVNAETGDATYTWNDGTNTATANDPAMIEALIAAKTGLQGGSLEGKTVTYKINNKNITFKYENGKVTFELPNMDGMSQQEQDALRQQAQEMADKMTANLNGSPPELENPVEVVPKKVVVKVGDAAEIVSEVQTITLNQDIEHAEGNVKHLSLKPIGDVDADIDTILPSDILAGIKLDDSQMRAVQTALDGIKDPEVEVKVKNEEALNEIEEVQTAINNLEQPASEIPEITVNTGDESAEGELALNKLTQLQTKIDELMQNTKPIIDVDTSAAESAIGAIQSAIDNIHGKTVTINIKTSGGVPSYVSDSINSDSQKQEQLSMRGRAAGNFGLAKSKGTLMGELGPELVVSNGRYFVAGRSGPEMVDLDKDAIVFNHLQTEQLLKHGMSSERGRAVTNEQNAVAFATGNINGGPAMASAAAALAALKQLRAMWEALQNVSAQDLAGKGGGGGGGGGNDNPAARKAWIAQVERWYDLMQKIAQCEKDITHEQKLRTKLNSDYSKNGKAYYASQKESLKQLQAEIDAQEELNLSRSEYFDQRRRELNEDNGPFNQLYTFDENGQLQYRHDITVKGSSAQTGFEFLSELVRRDEKNKPVYSAEQQYQMLINAGFGEYMKYTSSGEEIVHKEGDDTSFYTSSVQAVWDYIEAQKKEMQELHDAIEDGEASLLDKLNEQNELLAELRENQLKVEQNVLKALEESRQREIDELSDTRKALDDSTKEFIDGLTNALDKERQMYETEESQNELDSKRRKLAILQRSGGSASEIASLQEEINTSEQDLYFDLQQQQIDAIQEASNLELERLDRQIELMTETLEYQKTYGLLWGDVYQIMAQSPAEIANYIAQNTQDYWGKSALDFAQSFNQVLFETEQWGKYRDDVSNIAAWATLNLEQNLAKDFQTYNTAMETAFGKGYDPEGKYKKIFENVWRETGDITKATEAARNQISKDKDETDRRAKANKYGVPYEGTGEWAYTKHNQENHYAHHYKKNDAGQWIYQNTKTEAHSWSGSTCSKCGEKKQQAAASSGGSGNSCKGTCTAVCKDGCGGRCGATCREKAQSSTQGAAAAAVCRGNCTGSCTTGCKNGARATTLNLSGYASGGFVSHGIYELGERGTETVLTAEQTRVLRNNILSNRPSSLISLLKTYNEGFSRMNTPLTGETSTDNSTNIENVSINMNVQQISNDYDARRAGEQAMNEIMRIARKTSAANSIRR